MSYTEKNSKIIDKWVTEVLEWSNEISHEDYILAKENKIGIFLTLECTIEVQQAQNVRIGSY